jgi:hypothetical protein
VAAIPPCRLSLQSRQRSKSAAVIPPCRLALQSRRRSKNAAAILPFKLCLQIRRHSKSAAAVPHCRLSLQCRKRSKSAAALLPFKLCLQIRRRSKSAASITPCSCLCKTLSFSARTCLTDKHPNRHVALPEPVACPARSRDFKSLYVNRRCQIKSIVCVTAGNGVVRSQHGQKPYALCVLTHLEFKEFATAVKRRAELRVSAQVQSFGHFS